MEQKSPAQNMASHLDSEAILSALREGEITVQGEFVWGSNYTFLADIHYKDTELAAVYKPSRGQRPLWDFAPATLAHREAAAYLVSRSLGWDLVPPTIYRRRAPVGAGSLQLFVEHDPEYHYFNMSEEDRLRLRPVALFDLLVNNADRKGSHILRDPDGHLWLIDHGLCFHEDDKLRTVIWDFTGEPIPDNLLADLSKFSQMLELSPEKSAGLHEHISQDEFLALVDRAHNLLHTGHFPNPPEDRRAYPWPPV
jgi:uncharacterized repeat protein (TIGR03843 family)